MFTSMAAAGLGICICWTEPSCMQAAKAAAGHGIFSHWTEPVCMQA